MNEPLLVVQSRLTDRDLTLLGWLADHGVLTTGQIAHALYPSLGFAQRRLLKLVGAGVLDRFRPQRPGGGTYAYHYLLAQLGVEVVAAQRGEEELPRRDRARKTRWWLTNRANLPHRLAVNGFFTDLAGYARAHPGTGPDRWWPSGRCQQKGAFADLLDDTTEWFRLLHATVAADGHGIWSEHRPDDGSTVRVPFFVEIDLGTEDLGRVAAKVTAYQRFAQASGRVWPVLFWLGSPVRERHLHTEFAERRTLVPVATATGSLTGALTATADPAPAPDGQRLCPADAVWRLHHDGRSHDGRLTLAGLADTVTRIHQTWP